MSVLLDTNILLYTLDERSPDRRRRATEVLSALIQASRGHLSVQALAEFSNASLKKFAVDPNRTLTNVQNFKRTFTVHPLTAAIVSEALRGVRDYQLAYYDAQMWACAKLNNLGAIFSEDFNVGARLEGVEFVNPFAPEFDLVAWT